jgi:hypothetical protein
MLKRAKIKESILVMGRVNRLTDADMHGILTELTGIYEKKLCHICAHPTRLAAVREPLGNYCVSCYRIRKGRKKI